MSDFFRFPHTSHIAWLGQGRPRDDKVLSPEEARAFLQADIIIEEKVDGANLGFSVSSQGELRAQNRGHYLEHPFSGQFSRLETYLAQHEDGLIDALSGGLILFGEWCAARHSLGYERLPDLLSPSIYTIRIACAFIPPKGATPSRRSSVSLVFPASARVDSPLPSSSILSRRRKVHFATAISRATIFVEMPSSGLNLGPNS